MQQEQYGQQPGMFDRAKAYVPSLHSSSHQTEESPSNWQHTRYNANTENQSDEPHPSLLDKAKAYIPVLGSSTDFDPATEARRGQEGRLYQEYPEGQTGFEPENSPHESLLDKARAYMPAMGAPGTTSAGIDVSVSTTFMCTLYSRRQASHPPAFLGLLTNHAASYSDGTWLCNVLHIGLITHYAIASASAVFLSIRLSTLLWHELGASA